jgi:hypothetical protein
MTATVERAYVVSLSIPDNEAFTALSTLTRMGLAVTEVRRADVWVARVDPARIAEVDRALATVETIFNPNKHRLEVRSDARPRPGEVWVMAGDETPATTVVGRAVPGVLGIVRRTSWRLVDGHGSDIPAADLQRAIDGFLCNPAFQKAMTT